ncbi:MAG: malic enzyme-like NAD(P)-binding protein [Anaerovibrio sp.]|nr:malic enzyme-like NAD(P)-binding protein [Anaerovibrio lipolyticus]MCF2600800.1 NAD-dependent malic enzyme [Anaerovibrio lipolyticus]MCI6910391.1 NAD-dependent malic enzyme [Veillonellaceae bacterium]MDY4484690.1 malic enzyme-like NAD(P)-binding protein [Anaerovibrio sp.]MDY5052529.1 malic enzyme-like NAD(P)-binding protein [Anaerovibrio sp.]
MSNVDKAALELHKENQGKLEIVSKVDLGSSKDLTLAYTPGVAAPCLEIKDDYNKIYDYTTKSNMVAVVTNGTAVLGLGNIGAGAGLPVMEGKAVLFKSFAGVDAVPLCLNSRNVDDICQTVEMLEPGFGGINLEDIKAPECFDIETRLKETMNIPVFHDDQHGTAVVAVSALMNGFKLIGKRFRDAKVVVNGAGAAGMAITRLLQAVGTKHIILCDTKGAIYEGRLEGMNPYKEDIARITNKRKEAGSLVDVIKGADVFIGVSVAKCVTEEMVRSMNKDAIIMAMANPEPEIMPELAKKAGARIVCTGRSDFPNQVNNLLAFPGIFRGALDVRATDINTEMKIAAATAIASLIPEEELSEDNIIISPFDKRVAPRVASAVAQAAIDTGVATNDGMTAELVAEHTMEMLGA